MEIQTQKKETPEEYNRRMEQKVTSRLLEDAEYKANLVGLYFEDNPPELETARACVNAGRHKDAIEELDRTTQIKKAELAVKYAEEHNLPVDAAQNAIQKQIEKRHLETLYRKGEISHEDAFKLGLVGF